MAPTPNKKLNVTAAAPAIITIAIAIVIPN